MTVGSPDVGVTATPGHRRDFGEGYLGTIRCSNTHSLDVGQRAAFLFRIADHDAHVLPTSLHAQGLVPVEALPYLASQSGQRQSQRPSARLEGQLHLHLAFLEAVLNVACTGVVADRGFEALDGLQQLVEVLRRQLDFDVVAGREQGGGEGDRLRPRDLAESFADASSDFLAADVTLL